MPDDEQNSPATSECHSECFAQRDGFFENEGREEEGRNGHSCGDDASIDGRGETESDGEAALIAHKSENRSQTQECDVFARDGFTGCEQ